MSTTDGQSARDLHPFRPAAMRQFLSIQYLRGLAASMVVVYHLGEPLQRLGYRGGWPEGLSSGVDIFFVISGFVMWSTTRARPTTPFEFWKKRIVRIVPLYWIITTFMLTVLLIAPRVMQTSRFQLYHVVTSYLFIPSVNPGKGQMEPLVFPGWTLNYEMFFYLIFGLFLLVPLQRRLVGTVSVLAAIVIVGAVVSPPHLSAFGFYTSPLLLEFASGMVLGEIALVYWHRMASAALGWALLFGGLALLIVTPIFRAEASTYSREIPAFMAVLGGLLIESGGGVRRIGWLELIGNASFSIYLTQLISMAAFFVVWKHLHQLPSATGFTLFCVLDVAVAIAGGIACYWLVEKPLTRLFRPRRAPLPVPA